MKWLILLLFITACTKVIVYDGKLIHYHDFKKQLELEYGTKGRQ